MALTDEQIARMKGNAASLIRLQRGLPARLRNDTALAVANNLRAALDEVERLRTHLQSLAHRAWYVDSHDPYLMAGYHIHLTTAEYVALAPPSATKEE